MSHRIRQLCGLNLPALLLAVLCVAPSSARADSAIYGGGPFYTGGQAVMDEMRASGFTTVILFGLHPHENGDLHYNNDLIISNGVYVGDPNWPARVRSLKEQAPTSVKRIEFSIGGWGVGDFNNIKNLIAAQGTGPDSILYKNFALLKQLTNADAIDFDDESTYDLNSSTQFGNMLWGLGYSITLAPYTNQSYWVSLKNNLGSKVDGIHLQVYDGGAGNNPATWSSAMGMTVDPGLWSKHGSGCTAGDSPSSVQSKMQNWKNTVGIVGGFIWLYDDIQACASQGTAAQYAAAINNVLSIPNASFGYAVSGMDVSFSDLSSDPDGSIVSRNWNFGDGATSAETNPMHTYAAPGSYNVTLTVTDDSGYTSTKSDTVAVGLVNLALNRTATGSTACSSSETAGKAVNGTVTGGTSDKFCSLGDSGGFLQPKKYWLQVDLGATKSVKRLVVKHAGAGGESTAWNTKAYNIQVSANGSSWTTVATVGNNTGNTSVHDIAPTNARYVKLNVTTPAQDGNPAMRIYEFEVY